MTKLIEVFRVELPSGQGPYCGWPQALWENENANLIPQWELFRYPRSDNADFWADSERIPTPEADGIEPGMREDEFCGFTSIEKLVEWFDVDHMLTFLALGWIRIMRYEILDAYVREGRKQCVFVKQQHTSAERWL